MTSILDLFRMALAIHSSCFSLLRRKYDRPFELSAIYTHPVEKLSPPSDTEESRSRKTFALTVLAASSGVSSDGIRWTRRRASYYEKPWEGFEYKESNFKRTISASWYSSNTSKVDLRLPLKMVGSSGDLVRLYRKIMLHDYLRGMIVRRLRRSVKPTVAVSIPSTKIRPSVASTNRKKERARVLFPDPVRPRIPTLFRD